MHNQQQHMLNFRAFEDFHTQQRLGSQFKWAMCFSNERRAQCFLIPIRGVMLDKTDFGMSGPLSWSISSGMKRGSQLRVAIYECLEAASEGCDIETTAHSSR